MNQKTKKVMMKSQKNLMVNCQMTHRLVVTLNTAVTRTMKMINH